MCFELAKHFEQRFTRTKLEHLVNYNRHCCFYHYYLPASFITLLFATIHCWRHRAATLVVRFTIPVIFSTVILLLFFSFVRFAIFGVGVMRTNAFHLEEAEKK